MLGPPPFAPFSWNAGQDVIVVTDLFAVEKDDLSLDESFAVMAHCPRRIAANGGLGACRLRSLRANSSEAAW